MRLSTSSSGSPDCYAINRLVQELFSDPANIEEFRSNRSALCARYALSAEQEAALLVCNREALTEVGVHPILQMHLFLAADPEAANSITVKAYLNSAGVGGEETSHG